MVKWCPSCDWKVVILLRVHNPDIVKTDKQVGLIVLSNKVFVIKRARVI